MNLLLTYTKIDFCEPDLFQAMSQKDKAPPNQKMTRMMKKLFTPSLSNNTRTKGKTAGLTLATSPSLITNNKGNRTIAENRMEPLL